MLQKINHRELEQLLRVPICTVHWGENLTPEQELQARDALLHMLEIAKKQFHRTRIVFIGQDNTPLHDGNSNYLQLLLQIRHYLKTGQWTKACEDMIDVLHFFRIEDRRILGNLIATLEEFLIEKTQENAVKAETTS